MRYDAMALDELLTIGKEHDEAWQRQLERMWAPVYGPGYELPGRRHAARERQQARLAATERQLQRQLVIAVATGTWLPDALRELGISHATLDFWRLDPEFNRLVSEASSFLDRLAGIQPNGHRREERER